VPRTPRHNREWIELVVLSVLSDGPAYGYLLIKQIAAKSEGEMRLTPGVLYPALHEMEQSGLIRANWEEVRSERRSDEDDAEGRKRKWYRLTAKGRRRLSNRIAAHRAYHAMIEAFLPDPGEEKR